jgi:hypothetical protein
VFAALQDLFYFWSSSFNSLEDKRVLPELLNKITLDKWKMTLTALPSLYDTHHLPFLLMLLAIQHGMFEVEVPLTFAL